MQLFNAIGYVMERTRKKSAALRQVIAEAVRADPFTYTEGDSTSPQTLDFTGISTISSYEMDLLRPGFLGKENEEYCK